MTESLASQRLDRELMESILDGAQSARISLIGLSKNAGKTFVLNRIIEAAARRNLPLGLVSTGRDGEERDAITELPKPRIWAPTGAWVVTTAEALGADRMQPPAQSSVQMQTPEQGSIQMQPPPANMAQAEVLESLPFVTPFGRVIVGRVVRAGELLLIGPGSAGRVAHALLRLEALGARLCLVDGSFDRIAAAGAAITDRVVVAAGAAYSSSQKETIAQVRHVLDLFDLPLLPTALGAAFDRAVAVHRVSIISRSGGIVPVSVPSGLSHPEQIVTALQQAPSGGSLALAGALSNRLLTELLRRRLRNVTVAVTDPTHVLLERNLWRRWRLLGGEVQVRRTTRVCAVATNPHSPVGQDYDAVAFFHAVCTVAQRPVFDLAAGLSAPGPGS